MSVKELPEGLYEQVVTPELEQRLKKLDSRRLRIVREELDDADGHERLAQHVARELARALAALPEKDRLARQLELCNSVLEGIHARVPQAAPPEVFVREPGELLLAVHRPPEPPRRPKTPLATSTLLTGASQEPRLGAELATELESADAVDILVSFIKWRGWRQLQEAFQTFAQRKRRLRVLTTTYMGATELEALDAIARLPEAEVRVSYDIRRTRLHAKAWLFHRVSGLSTAYVGSANISQSALGHGLEWTLKASQADAPHIIEKFSGAFDSLWEDAEFERYDPDEPDQVVRLRQSLEEARGGGARHASAETMPVVPWQLPTFFSLKPYPFQQAILDQLVAERSLGRTRNLVVAATGTGKTMIAAFDYSRQPAPAGLRPSLLFVAHREELLRQARDTFRHVLRDESFGQLLGAGEEPTGYTHLFATIQSLTRRALAKVMGAAFWQVVIVDEFHHAEAPSYEQLLEQLRPELLLGLTATPERADGRDILRWFDGHTAAEVRLWDALNKQLLTPFEYYGIRDSIDLDKLTWTRGRYDVGELERLFTGDSPGVLYTGAHRRADLILEHFSRIYARPTEARALGFCVSVAHAEFMARRFTERGLPSLAVHGESSAEVRNAARQHLVSRKVNVLFTCDLYNEGVDIPEVDVLLFLRPTESPTIFLQQLGRGLRLHEAKTSTLVLDFIGNAHREFRFDQRFSRLTGVPRGKLCEELQSGFPTLPSGCHLQLDRESHKLILEHLRQQLRGGSLRLVQELRELSMSTPQEPTLSGFLDATGRPLEDVYNETVGGWTALRRKAGRLSSVAERAEVELNRLFRQLIHIDELGRLELYRALVEERPPSLFPFEGEAARRKLLMLGLRLCPQQREGFTREAIIALIRQYPALREELRELFELLANRIPLPSVPSSMPVDWPLTLHRHYHRDEILAAIGASTFERRREVREGRYRLESVRTEVFFVTLNKSEKHFSPTTRYQDYAISSTLFHWQSQSTTADTSDTGRRYVEQATNGYRFLLFVREHARDAFMFLGPVSYVSHTGSRPMSITWRLEAPIPAELLQQYATLLAV